MHLMKEERIEVSMMIGYGDQIRIQQEVYNLFNTTYRDRPQINQCTVTKIKRKYREFTLKLTITST